MDLHESDQELQKQSSLEKPRPPLASADKNNGNNRLSRTREVSSRYKSPTPRRCPSPIALRTGTGTGTGTSISVSVPKRAVSADRKRPSTPPSPKSPSTPAHDVSTESKKISANRFPEGLWPSTMRSLSVSFQSDTFSLPMTKREKPVSHALNERNSKSLLNSRKPTPERKRSPLKGKNSIDQTENSKPVEASSHYRWPSKTSGKFSSSSALTRSIDFTDKLSKNPSFSRPTMGLPRPRRKSLDGLTRPLQKSVSDAAKLVSFDEIDTEKLVFCLVDDNALRLPKTRSRPPSPNTTSFSRVSRPLSAQSSRGPSPSRIRPSSPSRQSNSASSSVLTFIADIRKGKKGVNHIEDVHQLRLLYNRHLQWRYANARADVVQRSQKVKAQRMLFSAWRTTSELWDSVTENRSELQQLRLKLNLYFVLKEQMAYLNDWASMEKDHNGSLSRAIKDLEASTLRLPLTAGARADIEAMKAAISSAVDMLQAIGSSICSTLSRVEGMNRLVSELAGVAAQERAMLTEYEDLLASTSALQVEEHSLRTHLVQLKQSMGEW